MPCKAKQPTLKGLTRGPQRWCWTCRLRGTRLAASALAAAVSARDGGTAARPTCASVPPVSRTRHVEPPGYLMQLAMESRFDAASRDARLEAERAPRCRHDSGGEGHLNRVNATRPSLRSVRTSSRSAASLGLAKAAPRGRPHIRAGSPLQSGTCSLLRALGRVLKRLLDGQQRARRLSFCAQSCHSRPRRHRSPQP